MGYLALKQKQFPIITKKKKNARNLISKKRTFLKKLKATHVIVLGNPPKNIDFKFAYKLPGDIYIEDHVPESKKFLGLLSKLNNFKKIISVYHDKEQKLIGCHLIDCETYSPPLGLLVHRLQTLGNTQAYKLSLTIENIIKKLNGLKHLKKNPSFENLFEKESYKNFLKKSHDLISEFTQKYPIIMCRGSNLQDLLSQPVFQISFNYNFLSIIGEEVKNFPLKLLKKGLPDCLWLENNYFENLNEILHHIFFPSQKETVLQYLIRNNDGKEVKSVPKSYVIKFEEDFYTEVCVVEVYEIEKDSQNLIKPDQNLNCFQKEISIFDKFDNLNLILDINSLQESSIKWINTYYPKFTIYFNEKLESDKKSIRCGVKQI